MRVVSRWMLGVAGILALSHPDRLSAQASRPAAPTPVAALRIRVTGEKSAVGASGVLPFASQGQNAVLSVVATDAAGRTVPLARATPTWTTSDEEVASLYGGSAGPTARVVAQQPGRALITVAALGKSASIPVVVGEARREIAAAELAPRFRVARLEVTEDGAEGALSGRALLLGENGHNTILVARAYAKDGSEIPLADFPITWASSDGEVIELMQASEAQARVVGREPGRSTVTATIQGVRVALEGYVGDARSTVDASLTTARPQAVVVAAVGVAEPATSSTPQLVATVAPIKPVVISAQTLPRALVASRLTVVGVYFQPLALTATTLSVTGAFIPARTLTTPRLTVVGVANP